MMVRYRTWLPQFVRHREPLSRSRKLPARAEEARQTRWSVRGTTTTEFVLALTQRVSSMSKPALTVVTASYNYSEYIAHTIESVLSQSFADFEYIIVDDCSTDHSPQMIQQYAATDSRIRPVLRTENLGFVATLREAYDLARGRYLVNIDSDDWITDRDAFRDQVGLLESEQQLAFVYSPKAFYRDERSPMFHLSKPKVEQRSVRGSAAVDDVLAAVVTHSGTMMRAESYRAVGGYDANFRYTIDWKLWIDLCGAGDVGYIDRPLYAYRQHSNSMSTMKRMLASGEAALFQSEIVRIAEAAYRGFDANGSDGRRRAALRRSLTISAVDWLFRGETRTAWETYLVSLRLRPLDTLLQRNTAVMVARTLLGARGFDLARSVARLGR